MQPPAGSAAKADGPRQAIESASSDFAPFTMLGAHGGYVGAAEGMGDLLLIGLGNRVATLVLNEARQPRLLGESELLGGDVRALSAEGNRVAAALGTAGLAILDLSEPARPQLLGSLVVGGEVRSLALQGNRVLLVDDDFGLYMVSLDDVRRPSLIGPGLPMLRGTESLVLAGNRAYLGGTSGITVVDVTRPEEPEVIAELEQASSVNSLVLSGKHLIAARGSEELSVLDISEAAGPKEIAHFSLPTPSYDVSDLAMDGSLLLVATAQGHWLLDMSQPRAPTFLNQPPSSGPLVHLRLAAFVDEQPVSIRGAGRIRVHDRRDGSEIASLEPPFIDAMGELDSDGRWLALGSDFDRSVSVFDLTDPTRPQLMGVVNGVPVSNGILIAHEHLILASWEEGGDGKRLQVYNIVQRPFRLEHEQALPASFHELAAAPFGFTFCDGSGVTLMGLSAAGTPSLLGQALVEGGARRARVFDQQMVALNATGAWIHKFDISDPAAARLIDQRSGSVDDLIDVDTGAEIFNGNSIRRIDLWSASEPTITASAPLPESVPAFTMQQRRLYAYGPKRLAVFDFDAAGGIGRLADIDHQGIIRRLRVSGDLLVAGGQQLTIWRGRLSAPPTPAEPGTATPLGGSAEPPQPTRTPSPLPTTTLLVHLELQSELGAARYQAIDCSADRLALASEARVSLLEPGANAAPKLLGEVDLPPDGLRDLVLYRDVLYAASGSGGLWVADATRLADRGWEAPIATTSPALGLLAAGDHLVVATEKSGLGIYSLAQVLRPRLVGNLGLPGDRALQLARSGDLLLLSTFKGLLLTADLSSPGQPRVLGRLAVGSGVRSLAAAGERAWLVDAAGSLLEVDLSEPDRPRLAGRRTTAFRGPERETFEQVFMEDGLAMVRGASGHLEWVSLPPLGQAPSYLSHLSLEAHVNLAGGRPRSACTSNLHGGVALIDATSPESPSRPLFGDADGGYRSVASDGDTVVGLREDGGMHRIDFSDPKRPVPGPTVTLPGQAYGIALAKGLAYVLANPAPGGSWENFHVYRIHDAAAPELLGSTDVGIGAGEQEQPALMVRGTWVLAVSGSALFSVDVKNPARMKRSGIVLDNPQTDPFGGTTLHSEGDLAHLLSKGSYLQLNIKSPPNPKQLRIPYLELPSGYMHLHRGHLAIFSFGNAVVDVRREGEPHLVASTRTSLGARYRLGTKAGDLLLVGPWGGPLLAYDFSRPPALVPVALSNAPMGFTSLSMAKDLLLVARAGQGLAAYKLRYPRFLPRVSRGAAPRGR